MTGNKTNFRYDINALRAIAVIGVIFFHFKVDYFGGAFSGVDIFFVISGYLMTRIIINGISKGNFSILDFYNKRVQRIVPALLFLVLILIIVSFFIYLPEDYQLIAKRSVASMLFYSNILYWKSNYFDPSSDTNILLHTWSLSVEWQFYLILPVALVILNKFYKVDKKKYLILFTVSTVLLFILSIVVTKIRPNDAFYFLPTRCWEMLAGGIVFLAEDRVKSINKNITIGAYIVLFLCFIGLNEQMEWPGFYTLLPVLSTVVIILSNYNDFKIFKLPAVQNLGKISYSLYLWHWPVYVTAGYFGIPTNFFTILGFMLASVILAILSHRYVESIKFNNSRNILIATGVLVIITSFLSLESVNQSNFKKETLAIFNYDRNHREEHAEQFNSKSCFISSQDNGMEDYNMEECLSIVKGKKNVLLLGDSHSAHLSQSIRENLEKMGINLNQASAAGCLPLIKKNGSGRCSEIIDYIYLDYLPKNAKDIDGVIISANWISGDTSTLAADIKETVRYLENLNIKTVIIGQNETYKVSYSSIAAREYEYNIKFSEDFLESESLDVNKFLSKELKPYYIDIYRADNFPKLSVSNIPYMFDENHFTKYGADQITEEIVSSRIFNNFIGGLDKQDGLSANIR